MSGPPRRLTLIGGIVALVLTADQASKTWALEHLADGPRHVVWTLRLDLTFNSGIAFSQATGATVAVTVIGLVVLTGLVVVAYRSRGTMTGAALGLVIGGAAGNLVDRLVRHHHGAVVDFVDLRWWPVFNVADAAVTTGVLLLLAGAVVGRPRATPLGGAGR